EGWGLTSPRTRGEVKTAKSINPPSTKWVSRSTTKSPRTVREQTRRNAASRANPRLTKWGRASNLFPAHLLLPIAADPARARRWAGRACAAAGSRDGAKRRTAGAGLIQGGGQNESTAWPR